MRYSLLLFVCLLISSIAIAQDSIPWHHLSPDNTTYQGISLQQGLDFMKKKGKKQKLVIVAVIDSGIDTLQEDLMDRLWVNPNEIPFNGKDDDGNGLIDDIHGWNFLGGSDGTNINGETLESVRFYRENIAEFEGKKKSDIAKNERKKFKLWLKAKKEVSKKIAYLEKNIKNGSFLIDHIGESTDFFKEKLKLDTLTIKDVKTFTPKTEKEEEMKKLLLQINKLGLSRKIFQDNLIYHKSQLEKKYNIDYNPRPEIVGDNVDDITDTIYGNNDIKAFDSSHGTGVSGIIAAVRDNGIGTQGIVDSVKIMMLRVVPGGDERDKDVALAIRYAVNNGATIINGSFGKNYSKHPEFVRDAIDYAIAHDVLIIHAAGNSSENNDKILHYPTPFPKQRTHWIDVGASGMNNDEYKLAASFSNYGRKTVDIFAPGVDIYSTSPKNKYRATSGTSDAAPVVAGVAALVKAYFPNITATQLRDIILQSSIKHKKVKTLRPGSSKKKIKFKKLSTSASIVNAFEALKMADELFK